jgi:hypothetical protein
MQGETAEDEQRRRSKPGRVNLSGTKDLYWTQLWRALIRFMRIRTPKGKLDEWIAIAR